MIEALYKVKKKINIELEDELLIRILFEMNRYFDKGFTSSIQSYQKQLNRIFNQKERNLLRKFYYYELDSVLSEIKIKHFASISYTELDIKNVAEDCLKRLDTYGIDKIAASINERKINYFQKNIVDNSEQWLNYYKNKVSDKYQYSTLIINIDQRDFVLHNYNIDFYCSLIASSYDSLENYRHLILKVNGKIFDKNLNDITWVLIYKLGIYCENFMQFKDKFFPFKQEKSIHKLAEFINNRFNTKDGEKLASDFYNSISSGFKFEDCYIGGKQNNIILTYKKIVLDQSPIPCPACMTTKQSGNSFPELFLRSYECKNPNCPERSKSGRGKRFDEFGTYRYFKLVEGQQNNVIPYDLYNKWRRDIFDESNDIDLMLIMFYTWDKEKIAVYNGQINDPIDRQIININDTLKGNNYIKTYESLPIFILFSKVAKLIKRDTGNTKIGNNVEVLNEDSTRGLRQLKQGQIGAVITSPPYYNAREYSQWPTLIMYLIDMMNNAASVYDVLDDSSYYLYNIGDIVNTDNVYVESNMSKKRLQLGFLSCMIFETVGFQLTGNIIWDKGQVQSKRNSTVNLNSGYVKCINCYEHIFAFRKNVLGRKNNIVSDVKMFSPVIKINSKGENTYKHTAPFPPEMVELLRPFIDKNKYVLDPFLGSGTTVKWCKENGFKSIGFEINKEYYNLSLKRINNDTGEQILLFNPN